MKKCSPDITLDDGSKISFFTNKKGKDKTYVLQIKSKGYKITMGLNKETMNKITFAIEDSLNAG